MKGYFKKEVKFLLLWLLGFPLFVIAVGLIATLFITQLARSAFCHRQRHEPLAPPRTWLPEYSRQVALNAGPNRAPMAAIIPRAVAAAPRMSAKARRGDLVLQT